MSGGTVTVAFAVPARGLGLANAQKHIDGAKVPCSMPARRVAIKGIVVQGGNDPD